jgi:hypothetical protein
MSCIGGISFNTQENERERKVSLMSDCVDVRSTTMDGDLLEFKHRVGFTEKLANVSNRIRPSSWTSYDLVAKVFQSHRVVLSFLSSFNPGYPPYLATCSLLHVFEPRRLFVSLRDVNRFPSL